MARGYFLLFQSWAGIHQAGYCKKIWWYVRECNKTQQIKSAQFLIVINVSKNASKSYKVDGDVDVQKLIPMCIFYGTNTAEDQLLSNMIVH